MKITSDVLRGVSLFVAAVATAACSSDQPDHEFTVPKTLCGISVPVDALTRLLPASGKKLTAEQDGHVDDGTMLCNVSVDGHEVLVVSQERITAGATARGLLVERLSIWDQKSAQGGSIAYVDHAATSVVECRGAAVEEEDISTFISVLKPGRSDESAMKTLISGYTASLEKRKPCLPKP
ncbi:hypothetical protein [Streptomyces mangrovisoli]|uniref:DUF3558 domain-containing protein n=1 Tax=Streptomyces mangrovisoli TaxID=1428628 RepID=A0A1J4NTL5_9ACTN|nr:hypothetical protein [Streptomyces mangrovisoli]OIJ65648.1 hypothetical protein WN71_022450 [Streptomyces mangrovisoli]